ncbi:hypothetical protein [Nitrosomonas communis]|uniref:Uncharacterized protein n=1 Tax=Nitrosomonas communis TaxID=44574 RepID=A0A1H2TXY0_9PROT|nr:hypothetical protein [Nitrosomonas communis]SDW48014.1 hypothetical protein SAMN05421882_10135 [Nitrosomonas communis]
MLYRSILRFFELTEWGQLCVHRILLQAQMRWRLWLREVAVRLHCSLPRLGLPHAPTRFHGLPLRHV